MWGWSYSRFKDLKELLNKHPFHVFLCGFKIKISVMYEHMMNNQKHVKNT